MAHFAEIDLTTFTVKRVLVVTDDQQARGHDFLSSDLGLGGTWIQTSYNSRGGVHYGSDGKPSGKPHLRYNYAGIGYKYDSSRDAFIPPKPFPSWVVDEATCTWKAPTPMPTDGGPYTWNESTLAWVSMSGYSGYSGS
jgi:hypothetical protein